jgi:phosphatidylserine/phosphatidylglycerophosphate/cardiolipin synthase-like enzyme
MPARDFAAGFLSGSILIALLSFLLFPAFSLQPVTSPGAEAQIISLINSAEKSIDLEVYILTSEDVIASLKAAHDRGADLRIILERRVQGDINMEAFNSLSSYGIDVRWAPASFKLLHSKMIIIDGKKVIVGSHNLSNSALTSNREISALFEGNAASQFLSVFNRDWENST